jgi:predicted RNA binding protein YcfA (HicA-like mRNA interferase family)
MKKPRVTGFGGIFFKAKNPGKLGAWYKKPLGLPINDEWLAAVFLSAGFAFKRQTGSHRSYVKPGVIRPVVIPTYDEVPVFIIRNNLRTAGLSRDDYFKLLGEIR